MNGVTCPGLPVRDAAASREVAVSYFRLANRDFHSQPPKFYAEVLNKNTELLFLNLTLLQSKNQGTVFLLLKI